MHLKLLAFLLLLAPNLAAQTDFIDSLQQQRSSMSRQAYIARAAAIPFEHISAQPAKATGFLESILQDALSEKRNDTLIARIYSSLAISTYYEGKYDASLNYNLKAIHLYEKLDDRILLGDAYASLGHQIKRRDLKKGMHYMRKGIGILRRTNSSVELSKAYNNFGVLHIMNQDLDSALYYFSDGLKLVRERNDSLAIPYSLINIGYAYLEMGKTDLVLPYLDEAYAIRKAQHDQNGIAESLTNYGDYYAKVENYRKAIEFYTAGLEASLKIDYKNLAKYTAFELAGCYEKTGNLSEALNYLKQAEELEDEMLNEQTNGQIAALEVQFETERKEKELAEHKVLLNQQKVRETRKNYLLIGLGTLLLFLVGLGTILIRQYRFKQQRLRAEHALKEQLADEKLKNKLYQERQRISRDLHDNIGSQLSFLTSSMDNLRYVSTEQRVNDKLDELTGFTRETITKLRDTIWAMNSEALTAIEFDNRLTNYLDKLHALLPDRKINYHPVINVPTTHFSPTQGICLFRIIQESINNAIKYADFDTLDVYLTIDSQALELCVQDNGKGFDTEATAPGDGLKNMRYRAGEAGGKITIQSTSGKGTVITFEMPVGH